MERPVWACGFPNPSSISLSVAETSCSRSADRTIFLNRLAIIMESFFLQSRKGEEIIPPLGKHRTQQLLRGNGRLARLDTDSASAGGCLSQAGRLCPLFCSPHLPPAYFLEVVQYVGLPTCIGERNEENPMMQKGR